MKYIRTYETEEKFLTDKDSTSRGFRLKPTLYKYSEAGDHVQLELDDPRKHEGSTYMEITLDSDVEFSFYIGNAPDDTQTTMNCSIDWGDGTVETKTVDVDNKGFKLSHNYKAGSYKIELYDVERGYSVVTGITPVKSVKRVVLSNSVVSIGEVAFQGCGSLTSVHISESVTNIGARAFQHCGSLTSISIPEGITYIRAQTFQGCGSLTSVNIPESVTYIQNYAFAQCSSLASVHISEGVTSIGGDAFSGCSLTSVNIPESVTRIGERAFIGCSSLTSVVLPNNATISSDAFRGAGVRTTIDDITYCSDALIVGSYTFISTGFLTFYLNGNSYFPNSNVRVLDCDTSKRGDLIIPSTISYNGTSYDVTCIGDSAFWGCSLTSIHIPESITSIESCAFTYCSSLKSISSSNTTAPTLSTATYPNGVFDRLPNNGTLHIKPGATGYDKWLSKLPSSWTIVEDL